MLLCRTGRARSRELADGLGIAPSAATPLVDRLVEQKLACRVDDPDRSPDCPDPSHEDRRRPFTTSCCTPARTSSTTSSRKSPPGIARRGQGKRSVTRRMPPRASWRRTEARKIRARGEVAERSIAAVLKPLNLHGFQGFESSSPPLLAFGSSWRRASLQPRRESYAPRETGSNLTS